MAVSSEDFFDRKKGENFYKHHHKPVLVAVGLKTPANIGGMIRLAGNLGCRSVIFAGDDIDFNAKKIKRAAKNAYGIIEHKVCGKNEWSKYIPEDYTVIAIETAEKATNIYDTALPSKIAFVTGSERYGLDKESLSFCHSAVYIPMPGHTLSLNVVQAAAVSLFEWYRQQSTSG